MNTYHKASVFHHSVQAMDKVTEDKKHHTTLILWLCMQVNTCLDLAVWMFQRAYFRIKQGTTLGVVLDVKNVRCSFSAMPNPLAPALGGLQRFI